MESKVISGAVRESPSSGRAVESKLRYAFRIMFPDVQTLRSKYTVLKKAPWMLPVVWAYRPFYKLFAEPTTLKKKKEDLTALSSENVDARQQLLNFVGLEYRF